MVKRSSALSEDILTSNTLRRGLGDSDLPELLLLADLPKSL